MRRRIERLGRRTWLACGLFVWLLAISVRANPLPAAITAEKSQALRTNSQSTAAVAQDAAGYVGSEACLTCHGKQGKNYGASAHHRAGDPRTPEAAQSCESCHGPGSRHAGADDPKKVPLKNPAKLSAQEVTTLCTSCHKTGEHALWQGSQHETRGVACTSCHSQHSAKSDEKLLKGRTQMETCAPCHRDKVAKLDRSGHMPVREGKMECTSCHNVHGSTNVRLLRKGDSIAEQCTSCHADKRGPFLWEHAPARDGCVTCHDPHGSSNERMLVARTPILCQRCHVATQHPSTIYDAAAVKTSIRVYARSCMTCHANIHGSNHPNGQRFLR